MLGACVIPLSFLAEFARNMPAANIDITGVPDVINTLATKATIDYITNNSKKTRVLDVIKIPAS